MIDSVANARLKENWIRVLDDVAGAAIEVGRDPASVTVIGVTKYVDADVTRALFDIGCKNLGENRPQVLWQKAESLSLGESVRWHMIGHLQRNKIRRTLRQRPTIHSIDSARLLGAVAEESIAEGITTPVMLEVNISGEEAKTGMMPSDIRAIMDDFPSGGVDLIGIMAMAGWGTDSHESRKQFAAAREFRDALVSEFGRPLPHLSMGMSGDFAAAIAEGATMVRIGSRLYEGVVEL